MQLTGNLEDLGLGEIFQILSFSGKSGVLRIRNTRSEGFVIFRDGTVVKAGDAGLKEGVCEALLKEKVISDLELREAKKRQKAKGYSEPLGRIFMKEFHIPQERIDEAATAIIEKTVHSFFRWRQGYFDFELTEYIETPDLIQSDILQYTLKKGLNPQFLAMEGLRQVDESSKEAAPEELPEEAAAAHDGATLNTVQELLEEIGGEGQFKESFFQPAMSSKGLVILKDMLEELSRPMTFNEIVLLILRFTSEFINRSVVFTMKDGAISGFGQFGIELEGDSADQRVRKMRIPADEPSILTEALESGRIVKKELGRTRWNDYLVEMLGGHRPIEAFAAPLLVQGRAALVLYGDNVPEPRKLESLSALETFLSQTSIALEREVLKENALSPRMTGTFSKGGM